MQCFTASFLMKPLSLIEFLNDENVWEHFLDFKENDEYMVLLQSIEVKLLYYDIRIEGSQYYFSEAATFCACFNHAFNILISKSSNIAEQKRS